MTEKLKPVTGARRGRKAVNSVENGPTITRANLINKIIRSNEINRNQASEILKTTLEEIGAALSKGDAVKISSFGTFSLLQKNERVGRNPRTGKDAKITPRQVISFRASPIFKKSVSVL